MAAPSKNWSDIADTQIDADSPLDTTLLTEIRDNLEHLEEWLGMGYAAAQDHDHDGVNSAFVSSIGDGAVTQRKLTAFVVGDVLLVYSDGVASFANPSSYTKIREHKIYRGGALRIKFDLRDTLGGGAAYGQIFRNGTAVGTERATTSGTFVTYSEDISGWSPDDLLQLYVKSPGGSEGGQVQNFRVYWYGDSLAENIS